MIRSGDEWISEPPVAITLNQHQDAALAAIVRALHSNSHETFLLHGIPGSGKTQVYIESIRRALAQGKNAIVLAPEISLTPQTVRRFKSHFGTDVAVMHSQMSVGERYDTWRLARAGKIRIVIGPAIHIFLEGAQRLLRQTSGLLVPAGVDCPDRQELFGFGDGPSIIDACGNFQAVVGSGQRDIDPTDHAAVYDNILEVAPTLADLSLSMIPGEHGLNHTPSPRNNIILAQIHESPKKDINKAYATHFLDYKGFVSTEYLTNFVDSDASTAVVRDPQTGLRFLHFSVMPASVSVDYYDPKSQYFCNYQLNVSLRAGESIVLQYTRDLPIYIPENTIERVRASGLAIEDSFPVTDGRFRLAVP